MRELVIATNNKHKLEEIRHALAGIPFTVLGLQDVFGNKVDIEEPGKTLEGNAVIKAMTIGKRCGKLTLSDDTGLEVYALNGEPGVNTANWVEGTDEDRYMQLLERMKDVPEGKRTAQFRAIICVYDPERGDKIRLTEGICRGSIAIEAKVDGGFGYDPVFMMEEGEKMLSEFGSGQREKTHRGKALAKMKEILLKKFV